MSNPLAMFEVMAINQQQMIHFYKKVFNWKVDTIGDYCYIYFPAAIHALLGGIGQAEPGSIPRAKGITFYIQVDNLEATLAKVEQYGGKTITQPTSVDGYHFALFEDPECNPIGIILPFVANGRQPSAK